jgi:6-phosphogluconolactonase (cycloisomerase 2 family)
LTIANTYNTGGNGGILPGSVVDHTASMGALAYDQRHGLLYAVNAGSNTVSVFSVDGARLNLREIVPSGGTFPVSITVHDDLVYVLNALDGGSVAGFHVRSQLLDPIAGSQRSLGLDPNATPQFTGTPGQVGFSPMGGQLVVTTKAGGQSVDTFQVGPHGLLSASPVVNSLPGTVPFAFDFVRNGTFALTEAGTNTVASFALDHDGTLAPLSSVPTGQMATCWIAGGPAHLYASNAGSGSLTEIDAGHDGTLTFVGNTATDHGTVDATVTPDGGFLYVQTGAAGIVDGFRVNTSGGLALVGSTTVANSVGAEGIVAT